jgi:hypothetical protein
MNLLSVMSLRNASIEGSAWVWVGTAVRRRSPARKIPLGRLDIYMGYVWRYVDRGLKKTSKQGGEDYGKEGRRKTKAASRKREGSATTTGTFRYAEPFRRFGRPSLEGFW